MVKTKCAYCGWIIYVQPSRFKEGQNCCPYTCALKRFNELKKLKELKTDVSS
jgi:hypothetical protein